MAKREGPSEPPTGEPAPSYTIDDLAALARVPSRTIRFYQAQKILPRPQRRGRIAVYTEDHRARLELIAQLQDRGLRIRGMKQLLAGRDQEAAVREWLGLSELLSSPWSEDRPRVVDEAEMTSLLGDRPAGTLGALLRARLVRKREDAPHGLFLPSPALLDVTLRLVDAGVSLDVLLELGPILQRGLRSTVREVVDYFVPLHHPGDPDGDAELGRAIEALRTHGAQAVGLLFAQEVERALQALLEKGVPRGRRKPASRPPRRS
jgi:DNA-binding transcriptional MerR regulator